MYYNQKHIVGQFSYSCADASLEPVQTSAVEHYCENSKELKTVNYFPKKASSQRFNWVPNTPLIWMYLVIFRPVYLACTYPNILCVIICLLTFIVH